MNQNVLIHCKPEYLPEVKELGLYYTINSQLDDEVDVKVPDIEYDRDGSIVETDEQLCEYYGIDFDQVLHIERI